MKLVTLVRFFYSIGAFLFCLNFCCAQSSTLVIPLDIRQVQFIDSSNTSSSSKLKQWNPKFWRILSQKEAPDSAYFWLQAAKLLQQAAKNGYPFATFQLDTLAGQPQKWQVIWRFSLNQAYHIGEIKIPDTSPVRRRVLAKALGLEANRQFSWLSYAQFRSRVAQLEFISLTDTPMVFFENGKAIWQIPIQAEKSTQAEGILGFQAGENDVRVTGDLLLDFKNAFRHADQMRLHYRSFPGGSQQFELLATLPYIGASAWGTQLNVNLFRRDSTFLELEPELSLMFKAGQNTQLRFFFRSRQTFPIQTALANFSTLSFQSWGITGTYQKLDQPQLPIRGWKVKAELAAGNRVQNEVSKPAWSYALNAQWHTPIWSRLAHSAGFLLQGLESQQLVAADLFRLGGVNSLRGFDEASLLSARWLLITSEPRFFLDAASYLMFSIQWAQGLRQNQVFQARSLGLGLGLKVKAGQFQLIYASGAFSGQPLQLNLAKVHLGYRLIF